MNSLSQESQTLLQKLHTLQNQFPNQAPLVQQWFLEAFIHANCVANGNQLTLAEIDQLIGTGLAAGGKPLTDHFRVMVFAQETNIIVQSLTLKRRNVSEDFLVKLHRYSVLNLESILTEGRASADFQIPYVLTEFIEWLRQQRGDEVKIAAEAYLRLVKLEIFQDQARQTGWLLLNWLLLQAGYPLLIANREQFEQLQQSLELALQGRAWEKYQQQIAQLVEQSLQLAINKFEADQTNPAGGLIKIGELAHAVNETVPTIRHWTKQGLLKVEDHSPGGYQLYKQSAIQAASKIRELQREKRLSLREIENLL